MSNKNIKKVVPFWLPPLGLATIAGWTPDHWKIKIIDENIEDIDFNLQANLIAISFMTANSKRAYDIADEFRKRHQNVILGGPHVTVCPEESLSHADSIVIGEIDHNWVAILEDCCENHLKKIYQFPLNSAMLNTFAIPRRDLFRQNSYLSINSIQTSRGCPYTCSFCSIASRYNGRYGKKDLSQVLDEVDTLQNKSMPIFFVDDNLLVDKKRCEKLLTGLIKRKVRWWSQADINVMHDEEMLDLAKESGCIMLVVGFESLSKNGIQAMNKHQNDVSLYEKFIKILHKHSILVNTSFTFGSDVDHEDIFNKTLDFLNDNGVIFSTFNILTPLPGTTFYHQMLQEGRITNKDWTYYDMGHPVFEPKHMSASALKDGYNWICKEFYSLQHIYKRLSGIPKNEKTSLDFNLILAWNLGYKKMLDTFGVFV